MIGFNVSMYERSIQSITKLREDRYVNERRNN